MRTRPLLPFVVLSAALLLGCRPTPDTSARTEALEQNVARQREELARLRSEFDAQRENTRRALVGIQSRLTDLHGILSLASAEIWGDGSSTGARLSMAQRALNTIQAEVDDLTGQLRQGSSAPRKRASGGFDQPGDLPSPKNRSTLPGSLSTGGPYRR